MSSKKSKRAQAAQKRLLRDRKALRKMGLLTKRVDLRKKPTPHQIKQIEKFRDVLSGRAKVFEASSKKAAKVYGQSYQVIDNKIIVPRSKGEKLSYDPETNELKSTRKINGKRVTRTMASGELGSLGPNEYYVIPFAGGQRFRTNDLKTLLDFMTGYEKKKDRPFKNWRRYVEIEHVDDAEDDTIAISRYRPKWKRKTARRKKRGR